MGTGSANLRRRRISTSAQCSLAEASPEGADGALRACHTAHGRVSLYFFPVEPQLVMPRMGVLLVTQLSSRLGYCGPSLPPNRGAVTQGQEAGFLPPTQLC